MASKASVQSYGPWKVPGWHVPLLQYEHCSHLRPLQDHQNLSLIWATGSVLCSQRLSFMEKSHFPALITHSIPGTVVTKITLNKPHVLSRVGSDHEKAIESYSNYQAIGQTKPSSRIHVGRFTKGRIFSHSLIHSFHSFTCSCCQ